MKHYYAYKSYVRQKPSYCLLPISDEAVYVDGMYYPDENYLLLLSKLVKERFQMVPSVDKFGQEQKSQGKPTFERIRLDTNYEHYVYDVKDLEWFANEYIVNATEFLQFVEGSRAVAEAKLQELVKEQELIDEKEQETVDQ